MRIDLGAKDQSCHQDPRYECISLWAPTNDTLRWVEHVERLRVQGTQNQGKHSQCNSEYDEYLMLVVHSPCEPRDPWGSSARFHWISTASLPTNRPSEFTAPSPVLRCAEIGCLAIHSHPASKGWRFVCWAMKSAPFAIKAAAKTVTQHHRK